MDTFQFNTIEEALEDFKQGKMIIVVDDGDVENDGALIIAGQFAAPEAVNFMLTYGKGMMTMPVSEDVARKIGVEELIWENRELSRSTSTVTIDSVDVTDGVSAADRSRTVMAAAAENAAPDTKHLGRRSFGGKSLIRRCRPSQRWPSPRHRRFCPLPGPAP